MKSIEEILRERVAVAIGVAFGAENAMDPLIRSADPKFADFQSNVAMGLAKKLGLAPREVAQKIVENLRVEDVCEGLSAKSIAGPGFINFRVRREFLIGALAEAFFPVGGEKRAGVEQVGTEKKQTVVIDYSGPNVAKQMHVGHLRSTIIGDTCVRVLEFLGHRVVRQNHIGDFGTQFGMLIHYLRGMGLGGGGEGGKEMVIEDLDRYYKEATGKFKVDAEFAAAARRTVVELQSGEKSAVALWNRMRVATRAHYTEIYKLLNVTLEDKDERGESFYGSRLPQIVERVKGTLEFGGEGVYGSAHSGTAADTLDEPLGHEPGIEEEAGGAQDARERAAEAADPPPAVTKAYAAYSGGAFCVFLPGYVTKEKLPLPMMLQKRDGGYPYSATDLAALYFRVRERKESAEERKPLAEDWQADRVTYFIDSRQSQHLAMLFDTLRAAQWDRNPATGQGVTLEHAAFGSILGEDGKPYKTRSGDTVKLKDLLIEAIERAGDVKAERGAELTPERRALVNRAVGIGAVKYADLRQDRTTDYVFAWERMLSLEGNTGPYLQMQYTRIRSIYRKGGVTADAVLAAWRKGGEVGGIGGLMLEHDHEVALAKKLLQFGSVVEVVARDLKPHHLCTYLYELCGAFSRFFESCPVLKAGSEELKMSRLLLCHMVASVLRIGLSDLLGIEVLEEM